MNYVKRFFDFFESIQKHPCCDWEQDFEEFFYNDND